MIGTEAAALCRYVKACCPQQKIDEYTPDAWHELLEDVDFTEAKAAAKIVAQRQPFVAPAEIISQVAATRRVRSRDLPSVIPPRDLADDPRAEIEWTHIWEDALLAGHTEDRARQIANFQMQVTEDEPLAIGAAAGIKAQMEAAALELVRKQSLKDADAREKAEAKRARYASIRAAELEAKEAQTDEETA